MCIDSTAGQQAPQRGDKRLRFTKPSWVTAGADSSLSSTRASPAMGRTDRLAGGVYSLPLEWNHSQQVFIGHLPCVSPCGMQQGRSSGFSRQRHAWETPFV